MGLTVTKFRQALERGAENEAMDLFVRHQNLKRAVRVNRSFGSKHGENTALHYVCAYGMESLLQDLLAEGANPLSKNVNGQTAFHLVNESDGRDALKRLKCLKLMLTWLRENEGNEPVSKLSIEKIVDKNKNSPLHYAANSGLLECVKELVSNGSPLYIENKNGQTACDIAVKKNFREIAAFLESKMVFNESTGLEDEEIIVVEDKFQSGLGEKELQETKDNLLVQTADMLQVSLFMAEGLLRYFDWSREALLQAWIDDPISACEAAGVTSSSQSETQTVHYEEEENVNTKLECSICCDSYNVDMFSVSLSCAHRFCINCWKSYLGQKITDGDISNIKCPATDCVCLVPVEVIESVVPKDVANKFGRFNIKAFVDSNPYLKWCPFPECGKAVQLPENQMSAYRMGGGASAETESLTVNCGDEHYFCWHCMEESHEPATCEGWKRWLCVIKDILPTLPKEDLKECPETERVANSLWLITNSKPCPKCASPIQKNEGCNHIKCTKCKHEFCWVCLESWKKHNSSTGGYFRCNRYEVVKAIKERVLEKAQSINDEHKKVEKLNHFLHYYSRFKNHENSYKLEEPLLKSAKDKMVALVVAAESVSGQSSLSSSLSTSQVDTSFVEDAIRKLLKARRVLRASYGYGFFLGANQQKKIIFELMQTELEEATENLSQMVARPYLRTPRAKIISAAQLTHRKREDLLLALSRGLLPPDDSPRAKRARNNYLRRYNAVWQDDSDEEFLFEEEPTLQLQRLIETTLNLKNEPDEDGERRRERRRRRHRHRSETLEYLNANDEGSSTDLEQRRLGKSRMLLAQESADLQKAIELSYYDMKSSNHTQGEHTSNEVDADLQLVLQLYGQETSE
ncbi:ankyrin repeat and IBR domain-containing protein 1-like [Xenia sp. Carnegie-2017]|uniref:ankyrin repeat and IBR domain-containing protein 1-like n=1 Tax=Xenia sp. Carnegie-2017 TaxID=2897299 RepID=UPI001F04682B|nr:ankyrin repeat and IBR domain-containing protein 1-like [Xenia sp. Carnegie-2017]XP_046859588.1 ankyrin repeat and IBR domain-containing protein 1-like [Xenia sp. Carnegie-2017]